MPEPLPPVEEPLVSFMRRAARKTHFYRAFRVSLSEFVGLSVFFVSKSCMDFNSGCGNVNAATWLPTFRRDILHPSSGYDGIFPFPT